jgi:beta-1,4-N-acetylglucosaminyltransferase
MDDLSTEHPSKKQQCTDGVPLPVGSGTRVGRTCFVTVGATAGFQLLLKEVIEAKFLQTLANHNFTVLEVQCGPDFAWFSGAVKELEHTFGVQIRCFDYFRDLKDHAIQCRGERGVRPAGCVVSHAGTGYLTKSEALDCQSDLSHLYI